jgi:phosphohistidine phosphatase SixA
MSPWRLGFRAEHQRASIRRGRLAGMKPSMSIRRRALCLVLPMLLAGQACADEQAAWTALRGGAIVLFRHANAPGVGDPPGMRLGDCSTQRNLDEAGRAQARRIGESLRREQVLVGAVWSSQWCRVRETADLAALGPVRDMAAFNSFFAARHAEPAQTAAARALLLGWRERGSLVVFTHQTNISALSGEGAMSGEGVVLRRQDGALKLIGRIRP